MNSAVATDPFAEAIEKARLNEKNAQGALDKIQKERILLEAVQTVLDVLDNTQSDGIKYFSLTSWLDDDPNYTEIGLYEALDDSKQPVFSEFESFDDHRIDVGPKYIHKVPEALDPILTDTYYIDLDKVKAFHANWLTTHSD